MIRRYNKATAMEAKDVMYPDWNPVLFWSNRPEDDKTESVGKECLSQWYACCFCEGSTIYSSAEQYMMYHKAMLFKDLNTAKEILAQDDPARCKVLGRQVRGFDEKEWKKHRCRIVFMGNLLKFTQNVGLRNYLVSTGAQYLVEASPFDRIWGIGLNEHDDEARTPARWQGLNLLGYVLMEVRDCLNTEEAPVSIYGLIDAF